MKRFVVILGLLASVPSARADFWGGDIPLLIQIVTNTLNVLYELRQQTGLLGDQLRGINDRIDRLKTIRDIIAPGDWTAWKDPIEAGRRLSRIYYQLPPEYRTEKSDETASELSRALSLADQLAESAKGNFKSGKDLEARAETSSPGVGQKLAASGIGSLVAIESQNQVAQAQIISLLTRAEAREQERTALQTTAHGAAIKTFSTLGSFADKIKLPEVTK